MKDYAYSFYNSKAWRDTAKYCMELKHYICERCGAPASIAHHKIYLSPSNINDPAISLNTDNIEILCRDCHNKEHCSTTDKLFDREGNLVAVRESADVKLLRELEPV